MNHDTILDAIGMINEEAVYDAKVYQRPKSQGWLKLGVVAACFAFVLAMGLPALYRHLNTQGSIQPSGSVQGGETAPSDTNPGNAAPAQTAHLVVNEAEGLGTSDMDVKLSYYEKLPYEEFQAFTGISWADFMAKIPDTWENTGFYARLSRGNPAGGYNDEYRLHDYVFDFQTAESGKATIALCPFEAPLRDYFIVCDSTEQSEVNGVPVTIYGYDGAYMVQFSYENVNYDIETSSISLEELQTLLTGILAASNAG